MKKSIIRTAVVVLMLTSFLFLQGCSYQVQLSQRSLIQGIGIDYESGTYRATVQVTQVSNQEENVVTIIKGEGDSAMDALNAVTLFNGKKPLYSHSLILVLGRSCAEEGLSHVMDFFIRYPESHPTVNILMADHLAEEILSTKQEDGKYMQARDIAELAKGGRYNGETVQTETLDVINQLRGEGSSPYLPIVRQEGEALVSSGTAVISGDQLVADLDERETRGLLLLNGRLRNGTAVVESPEIGRVTLELEEAKTQITPQVAGETLHFLIEVKGGATIGAADMPSGRSLDNKMYEEVGELLEEQLKQNCEEVIAACIQENHSDIFNFGRRVYQTYPSYWKQHGTNWNEEMAEAGYEVHVEIQLRRGGQEITGLQSDVNM